MGNGTGSPCAHRGRFPHALKTPLRCDQRRGGRRCEETTPRTSVYKFLQNLGGRGSPNRRPMLATLAGFSEDCAMVSALDQMRASPTTRARVREVDGGSRISAPNHTDQIFAGVGGFDYRGTESPSRSLTCSTCNQHADRANILKLLHYLRSAVSSQHSFKFRALNERLVSIRGVGARQRPPSEYAQEPEEKPPRFPTALPLGRRR